MGLNAIQLNLVRLERFELSPIDLNWKAFSPIQLNLVRLDELNCRIQLNEVELGHIELNWIKFSHIQQCPVTVLVKVEWMPLISTATRL